MLSTIHMERRRDTERYIVRKEGRRSMEGGERDEIKRR
jgi:hypothetical protein